MDISLGNYHNLTFNQSAISRFSPRFGWVHVYITSIVLGLLILCTIVGNVFVVAAIILERNLQSVSNYLILSLAVADLMVASMVMSVSVIHEVSTKWFLGIELCDFWVCFDVLCCSASILHLVAIAIDRYWAVTNIDYIRVRTARRIISMIALVWFLSIIISIPSRFYATRTVAQVYNDVVLAGKCDINPEPVYTIFSTVGAFYMPMFLLIGIYLKIYQTARARIRRRAFTNCHKQNVNLKPVRQRMFQWKIRNKHGLGKIEENTAVSRRYQCSVRHSQSTQYIQIKKPLHPDFNSTKLTNVLPSLQIKYCGNENESLNVSFGDPQSSSSSGRYQDQNSIKEGKNNHYINKVPILPYHNYQCNHDIEPREFVALQSPIVMETDLSFDLESYSEMPRKPVVWNWKETSSLGNSPRLTNPHCPKKECADFLKYRRGLLRSLGNPGPSFRYKISGSGLPHSVSWHTCSIRKPRSPRLSIQENCNNRPRINTDFTSKKSIVDNQRQKLEHKRERKAARTLAIITGCFILCWLPFFINAVIIPFCGDSCVPSYGYSSFCLWLGYCNSLLNPIIYTIFSPEFRNAFNKILFGRYQKSKRNY